MILKKTSSLLALVLFCGFFCAMSHAEIVVVVNSKSTVTNASPSDVADLYLNKRNDLGGYRLVPVDLPEGDETRNKFYDKVVGKTASQVKAYWATLIFTGKAAPPKQLSSDVEVAELVAESEDAIGYINAESVMDGVKVVYSIP